MGSQISLTWNTQKIKKKFLNPVLVFKVLRLSLKPG